MNILANAMTNWRELLVFDLLSDNDTQTLSCIYHESCFKNV
ncbi:hypothetical protein [Moraxella sp. ZY200743]